MQFASLLAVAASWHKPQRLAAADLKPETIQAYERYVRAAEARMEQQRAGGQFLYIETLPDERRRRVLAVLERGEVWTEALAPRDEPGGEIRIPDGLVIDRVGAALIAHVTLDRVLATVQDYERYQDIYKPDIADSRLLRRDDDTFRIYLRVRKRTPWVTPTFDINSEVHFTSLDARRVMSRAVATRIAQVANAGEAGEVEMTPGHDSGYLWRIQSYWRFKQDGDGVMAEWETVTLSRGIPFLLRWVVRPFVTRLARSTVENTLRVTRQAVLNQPPAVQLAPGSGQRPSIGELPLHNLAQAKRNRLFMPARQSLCALYVDAPGAERP